MSERREPRRRGAKRQLLLHSDRARRKRRELVIGRVDCFTTYLRTGGPERPSDAGALQRNLTRAWRSARAESRPGRPGRARSRLVLALAMFERALGRPEASSGRRA